MFSGTKLPNSTQFFFSYLDDNLAGQALLNTNGNFTKISSTWTNARGSGYDFHTWPDNEIAKSEIVPFVMPRSSKFTAHFKPGKELLIQFELEKPLNISSFSIFGWIYQPYQENDGILALGETNDILKPAIMFCSGWYGFPKGLVGQVVTPLVNAIKKSTARFTLRSSSFKIFTLCIMQRF